MSNLWQGKVQDLYISEETSTGIIMLPLSTLSSPPPHTQRARISDL